MENHRLSAGTTERRLQMNKKDRLEAVFDLREPDVIPVNPHVMAQAIYDMGWSLKDITTQTELDSDKVAEAFVTNIKKYDYDLCFGTYIDHGYGVPSLGGVLEIPEKFGVSVSVKEHPVSKKEDWNRIKKKFPLDPLKHDRMPQALKALKVVVRELGATHPISPMSYVGIGFVQHLFRKVSDLTIDCYEDPDWVDEMCQAATDFSMDWIRAQYEAGANTHLTLNDSFGTELISPAMAERFLLPYVAQIVGMVEKEFRQKVFMHIHGDMKKPKSYAFLERLVREAGVGGLHLDEKHDAAWIRDRVVRQLGVPAALIVHGATIAGGPAEKIEAVVKETIEVGGSGGGVLMAPSCQILPSTPGTHFKAWVEATHRFVQSSR
jgi:uroporphyrinogen-III decarboxylase